jgi:hypothetical protein
MQIPRGIGAYLESLRLVGELLKKRVNRETTLYICRSPSNLTSGVMEIGNGQRNT